MKIKKSKNGCCSVEEEGECGEDFDLENLPEKIVKVDEDIEVCVREISNRQCQEDPTWMSSIEITRQEDPDWLNASSLVLAGSPTKRNESDLWKKNNMPGIGKDKTSHTPMVNGNGALNGDENMNINCNKTPPNSPKYMPQVVVKKSPIIDKISNYNGNGDIAYVKSNLLKDLDGFKTLSPFKKNELSPKMCSTNIVSSKNSINTSPKKITSDLSYSPSKKQKCDSYPSYNDNDNNYSKPIYNLNEPKTTYIHTKNIKNEINHDTGAPEDNLESLKVNLDSCDVLNEEESDSDSSALYLSSSGNESFENVEEKKATKPCKREMKSLYSSLKEISWAQNWNPSSVLGTKKRSRPRRVVAHTRSKTPVKSQPSNKSKKKAVKILSKKKVIKSPIKKIQEAGNKKRKKLKKVVVQREDEDQIRYKLASQYKLKKVKTSLKDDDEIRYKLPKVKQSPIETQKNKGQVPKQATKKNTAIDTKKSFAIRFDFLDSKQNETPKNNNTKRKNDVNVTKDSVPVQMTSANKALFPELKVKLEPLDGLASTTKHGKLVVNSNKSKTHPNSLITCLQNKISNELDEKYSDAILEKKQMKKRKVDDGVRLSVRQTEGAFKYKEIAVKKQENFTQIVLIPNNKQNGLPVEAIIELKVALIAARKDISCKLVLLNSCGDVFCMGVDLSPVLSRDKLQAAERIANAIKELIQEMAQFNKPLVAAVNGYCFGLGVAMLPFCDVVFASDKAIFYAPYSKLGYIPEAALTLTLPQAVGTIVASNILLLGHKLTAQEAKSRGLVSEVVWPTLLMEEVVPRVMKMVSQPLKAMELTKMMLRSNQLERLKLTLENETRLLPKQWLSPICQKNIRNLVNNGHFGH